MLHAGLIAPDTSSLIFGGGGRVLLLLPDVGDNCDMYRMSRGTKLHGEEFFSLEVLIDTRQTERRPMGYGL